MTFAEAFFPGRLFPAARAERHIDRAEVIPPVRETEKISAILVPVVDSRGKVVRDEQREIIYESRSSTLKEVKLFDASDLPEPAQPTGIRRALIRARDSWLQATGF